MGPPLEPEIPKISPEPTSKLRGFTLAAARLNTQVLDSKKLRPVFWDNKAL